jgi:outer membrane usher protein
VPARDQRPPVLARLAVAAAALALTLAPRSALAVDQTLELEVTINGASTQKIGEFTLRDGVLLARPEELGELGLRVAKDAAGATDGLVVVSAALPGVTFSLDPAAQTVRFEAHDGQLIPKRLGADPAPAAAAPLESGTGATLNYEVADSVTGGRNFATGLFDLRLFSPWGVASTGLLAYAGVNPTGSAESPTVRLDSTYVYSDYASQRRYRLGDFITSGLTWTRPVRFGGVQVSRDFSMRPDLVTFPLPLVAGSAAVPSTVDVLVNGARVLSGQVSPGPFQVSQLPVLSGAGTVSMTVTDAVGRQVTTTMPFYASPSLLAQGLQTYSVETGFVRRDWGVLSNDYGAPAGSATYRRGLSSSLTVEAHAEGTSGQFMAGAGLVADAFQFAVVNVAVAGSTASGHQGASISVGFDRLAHDYSFGASGVFATSGYRDIAAMNGDPVPVRQISANAGLSLGRWGWAGVAYAVVDRELPTTGLVAAPVTPSSGMGGATPPSQTTPATTAFPFSYAQNVHVLTATYSIQLHHVFVYVNAFHDFAQGGGGGAVIGVTIPLGRRSSVMASGNTEAPYAQVQAQQSVDVIGDWGYQVFAGVGGADREFAQVQYKSPWALLTAGVDRTSGQVTGRVDVQGALSFLDGGLFASNLINDSFAVVDTSGVKGVPVLYENRYAGPTDSSGRRLVPDLRSFDVNHISIDPTVLPADALTPDPSRDVRPPDRSGVVVKFPVRTLHAALLVLQDERGRPIPVGGTATLRSSGAVSPIGYDGEAFFEDLAAQNRLDVQLPDGSACAVVFPFTPVKGDIPKLGPLTCRRAAP